MHREGSPLTNVVIGSVGPNTERPNTLHPGSDPIPAECVNQTVGCVEEHNDMNSHDWIWGSNCIHPYSDTLSRHPVSNHQGHQEIPGVSNNGYLPSSHFHHHHHLPQRTGASSAGIYIHNHHSHHHSNNQHHHQLENQQGHCANGHNNNNNDNNNNNNNYSIPVSNPDERPSHHPTLSLSVGYNAAAVAAAAAAIAAAASANSGLPGGMTLGSGKPKRRRIPTVAQRRAANIRERRRMFNLNEAFDTLRKRVPTFAYEKRLSRIETLRLAITYISFMTDVVSGKEPANIKLHGTKTFSWEALHALPPELTLHSKSLGL